MPLSPGDILNGHYRIEAEIGRGTYGRVYRGRDTKLDRPVAIKELARGVDELGSSVFADYVRRFEREARVQAGFNHPNIVHVYELIQESADRLYLVMELVDGESLRDALARRGPLPVDEAVRITSDILAGLAVVHADPRDIVHRDIKPSNVLLTKSGQAKLADFGLAQVGDESMRSGAGQPHPGTAFYMSPEQSSTFDYLYPASDVFSVGCVLFEMLTGVTYKRAQRERQTLQALRPDTAEWLAVLTAQALAKDPEDRPANGAEMGRLLAEAQGKAEEEAEAARLAEEEQQQREAAEQTRSAAERQARAEAIHKTARETERWRQAEAGTMRRRVLPWGVGAIAVLALVWVIGILGVVLIIWQQGIGRGSHTVPPTWTPIRTITTQPTSVLGVGSTRTSAVDGMVQVYVPAGWFLMGSNDADPDADDDEKPQRQVYLDAFWIDRTEVTSAQYARCVAAGSCGQPRWPTEEANHPIESVYWRDASIYCRWAGRRLPTEAEWEKATRGTDGRIFPWGNQDVAGDLLNFMDRTFGIRTNMSEDIRAQVDMTVDDGFSLSAPVGTYPKGASPYGALDMAGNAWEWVADWYDETYYASAPSRNPTGPTSGQYRIWRGGAAAYQQSQARTAARFLIEADWTYDVGFRCVSSP